MPSSDMNPAQEERSVLYAHGAFIYLVNSEHIEMCDVVLLSIFDSGSALLLVYQFTHIFIHKLSLNNTTHKRADQQSYTVNLKLNVQKPAHVLS